MASNASSSVKGMIFLEPQNNILERVLTDRLGEGSPRPIEPMDLRVCDFDDVMYNLIITEAQVLTLSLGYRPYKDLERFGAKKYIQDKYNNVKIVDTKSGFDITLETDLSLVTPESSATLVSQLSSLKRNVLGAPLEKCFDALKQSTSSSLSPIEIPFRKEEKMYIQPQDDRIIVLFSIAFEDKTDQAIARVFLQEMAEAGRRVNNAPPISFSKDPPLELRTVPGINNPITGQVGFLSIAVFPSHVSSTEKRDRTVTMIQGLRNYLHYHIKTTKSYLHSRMRKRVDMLLTVLNRAHPEKDPSSKSTKKTIAGKTFTRS